MASAPALRGRGYQVRTCHAVAPPSSESCIRTPISALSSGRKSSTAPERDAVRRAPSRQCGDARHPCYEHPAVPGRGDDRRQSMPRAARPPGSLPRHHLQVRRAPYARSGRRSRYHALTKRREALAVRYDAGVADASAAGITPSWVRTVAKSQYSLSRWISPSSASSRIEATRTSTCCPVPGGSGPNCPL
jgi:hypothetical protein